MSISSFLEICRFLKAATYSENEGEIVAGSKMAGQKSAGSRVRPRTIFLPSGSSASLTPASARSARLGTLFFQLGHPNIYTFSTGEGGSRGGLVFYPAYRYEKRSE